MRRKGLVSIMIALAFVLLLTIIPGTAKAADWEEIPLPFNIDVNAGGNFDDVWGSSPEDIFVVGEFHWLDENNKSISSPSLHYDGNNWTILDISHLDYCDRLRSIWGTSAKDVFATDGSWEKSIVHYDGNFWSGVYGCEGDNTVDIWGSSPDNVFAVGDNTDTYETYILRYNGTEWTYMDFPDGLNPIYNPDTGSGGGSIWGVWGTSPTDVYAVGKCFIEKEGSSYSVILHYNGEKWSLMHWMQPYEFSPYKVWGSSASDIFVLGHNEGDKILHYDGTGWSFMEIGSDPNVYLCGIWGSSASDVYVVGSKETIFHYDGNSWTSMTNNDPKIWLGGIGGSSADNIFAVGSKKISEAPNERWVPVVLHYGAAAPPEHTLTTTIDPAGSGTVELDPPGGTYQAGTTVTLTATPAAGYTFDHWSGDLSGSTNPATIIMDANKNVTAHFIVAGPQPDVNNDNQINVLDMVLIGQKWGQTGSPGWIKEDVNQDGKIDVLDMILVGQHWTG